MDKLDYTDFKFAKPIKIVKPTKQIKSKSKTSRNVSRSLSKEIITSVYERDNFKCIIPECCERNLDLPHHVYFWIEANRNENRNNEDQLVSLCQWHHHWIHHWWREDLREYCKFYLINYYKLCFVQLEKIDS